METLEFYSQWRIGKIKKMLKGAFIYVGIFILSLVLLGLVMAYKMGRASCRLDVADQTVERVEKISQIRHGVEQKVLATPADGVLDWLLQNWRRAD